MREDSQMSELLRFFKNAQEALAKKGEEDAAFYFEQCSDWIQRGNTIRYDETHKILGL